MSIKIKVFRHNPRSYKDEAIIQEFLDREVKSVVKMTTCYHDYCLVTSLLYVPKDEKEDAQCIETLKAQQEMFEANKKLFETQQQAIIDMLELFKKECNETINDISKLNKRPLRKTVSDIIEQRFLKSMNK